MAKKDKPKRYIVDKPWGKHKKGDILTDCREVRRKIQEGGTVSELTDELLKKKRDEKEKRNKDLQKMQQPVENKMEPDTIENKGDKK